MLLHWWRYILSSGSWFSIPRYCIIRNDRNENGGGILSILHWYTFSSDGLQTSIFKCRELSIYLSNAYNFFCPSYKNITLIRYFITKPGNEKLNDFCEITEFEHLIAKPTFFQYLLPSTIDLILTNRKQNFLKLNVYEKGISDHLKMILLVFRKIFPTGKLKIVFYRCCKNMIKTLSTKHFKTRFHNLNCHLKNFMRYFSQ